MGKAIADYSDAIRLAPNEPMPYGNRAIAYGKLGEFQKADADKAKAQSLAGK